MAQDKHVMQMMIHSLTPNILHLCEWWGGYFGDGCKLVTVQLAWSCVQEQKCEIRFTMVRNPVLFETIQGCNLTPLSRSWLMVEVR